MTTENPKVSAYVLPDVYDALVRYKEEQGLKSISLAVSQILEDYLLCDPDVPNRGEEVDRLEVLEGKLKA